MKICILASGSKGNCIYIEGGGTHLLVDSGLSCRETERRLAASGIDPAVIQAICVTHEHDDHISGIGVMQRKRGVGLYANSATIEAINAGGRHNGLIWNVFEVGQSFFIGGLKIEPFSVPHDAYDPVGFRISDAKSCAGIVTDMGMVTSLIRERLRDCSVVVVESNHDGEMLKASERPWSLKQRITGRHGHLSNIQACELLEEIADINLKMVFLAHISSDCNEPALVERCARDVLAGKGLMQVVVELTYASRPTMVFEF